MFVNSTVGGCHVSLTSLDFRLWLLGGNEALYWCAPSLFSRNDSVADPDTWGRFVFLAMFLILYYFSSWMFMNNI